MPPKFPLRIREAVLKIPSHPLKFLTGLSPSEVRLSRRVQIFQLGLKDGLITPHLLTLSSRIQFAPLLLSVALTYNISIDLFSFRY